VSKIVIGFGASELRGEHGCSSCGSQAIPSAFPALINPAARALAIAKRWWMTLQHSMCIILRNICSDWSKCSTGLFPQWKISSLRRIIHSPYKPVFPTCTSRSRQTFGSSRACTGSSMHSAAAVAHRRSQTPFCLFASSLYISERPPDLLENRSSAFVALNKRQCPISVQELLHWLPLRVFWLPPESRKCY